MNTKLTWIFLPLALISCSREQPPAQAAQAGTATAPVAAAAQPGETAEPGYYPVGTWTLVSLGEEHISADAEIFLEVQDDGKFAGSAGCNRYFGNMRETESGLSLGPIGSTMMACEQSVLDREQRFLRALEQVVDCIEQEGLLTCADGEGITLMSFAPQGSAGE